MARVGLKVEFLQNTLSHSLLDFSIHAVCCAQTLPNRGRSNHAQVNDLNMYYEIHGEGEQHMYRNIKALFNFEPPVNDASARTVTICAQDLWLQQAIQSQRSR